MNFNLINNHILITIETNVGNKVCVFDTGSPLTLFFDDNVREYSIDGITYNCNACQSQMAAMLTQFRPRIEKMIGVPIDGFIGTDIIMNSSIVINFPNEQLEISLDNILLENGVRMDNIHGLPIFDISINGRVLRAAFDSGAMYSFVASHFVENLGLEPLNRTTMDFNPTFGEFEISLFNGEIKIGDTNLGTQTIAIGSGYDNALRAVGVDAFIGNDTLKNSEVCISFLEKRFGVR